MKKSILTIIQACVFIAFLLASESVFAEGSATLYPSGATGKRASLNARSRTVPRLFDIFPTPGTMKVYVKAGETLYVGSSAQGISQTYGTPAVTYTGTINLRAPNGTTYSSGTSTTVGLIANRTEELAGPNRTGITTGYTPYTRIVESAEEGIWEVDFVPPTNPDTTSVPQYDIDANASWVQPKRAMIVAWDVSVGSASSPATLIPGRVYMNNFNGNLASIKEDGGSSDHRLDVTLYVLTDAGYKFRVKTNGFNGKSFNFFVNNKGVQNTNPGSSVSTTPLSWKDGTASYLSKAFTQTDLDNNNNTYLYDPRQPDNLTSGNPDITHKIFYNTPATDMPASAPITYNGGTATTTWLNPSTYPDAPTISNLSVVGVESGTTGLVGPDGAYIRFNSNVPGTYTITLTFSTEAARTLTGNCVAGLNQIFWDGKNGSGATVSSGVTVTAQNTIRSGEMHFPFEDVEINPNGIIIELLQSNNSLFSPNQDIVYWNDKGLLGENPSSPLENSTTGSSSNSNGHKWGIYAIRDIETQFGDNKLLDTWTYVKGSASSPTTLISYKSLDLAVSSITPNVSSVVVGNTITYTIVVTNPSSPGYTDNAVGASFGFTAPAGFNITSATAVQNSGTFSETSRSAVSGNTFSSVFNLISNGQATYTITGTVGTTMAHTSAAATAYVMRPADYTDKDATSAIVGAPTNPQTECDGGTSETGCNNIKTSSSTTISNSTPVAVDDAGTVNEDATLTVIVPGVKTNDTDADGDALTVASIRKGESEGNGTPGTLGTALAGNYGTINILADGSYTYIANNAQSLAAGATALDYFNYTISDGNGGTDVAVIDITITGTNDAPVAVNDAGAVNENATLTVPANGVLGNDTDIDTGNTKTVTSVRTGDTEGSGTSGTTGVALPGVYGTLTLYADGSYTYLANNASALAASATAHDYFNYTMSDGTASDIAVIDITITGTNDAPIVAFITKSGTEDTDIAFTASDFTNKFTDVDGNSLTKIKVVDLPANGTLKLNGVDITADQEIAAADLDKITFTPAANWNGSTAFNWNGSDGTTYAESNAAVNITVTAVNDAPVAVNDINTTNVNQPVNGQVLTNDSDPEGNGLTVITQTNVATFYGGSVTINQDGIYTYTPANGYTGTDTFSYQVCDDGNPPQCSIASVSINVVPPVSPLTNNPPVANNDTYTVEQGQTATVKVMANDSDPDGKTITVTSATGLNSAGAAVTLSNNSSSPTSVYNAGTPAGTAYVDASGNIVFTPTADYTGNVPFNYTISDVDGQTASAAALVTVLPVNATNNVCANDDANAAPAGTTMTGNILTNDTDPEGNTFTVTTATANGTTLNIGNATAIPGVGTLTLRLDGFYTFVPAAGFIGTVNVPYNVCDDGTPKACDQATLYLTSLPAVEATDDINQTPSGTPVNGNLLTNDKGLTSVTGASFNGSSLTVDGTTANTLTKDGVTYGTIVVNINGTYTFTPATGYTGPVPPITYTATNTSGVTDNANLFITVVKDVVVGANNPPVPNHDVATVKQGNPVTVNPLANDSDPDGNTLTVTSISYNGTAISTDVANPTTITVGGVTAGTAYQDASGNLIFTAASGYTGDVPFTYGITDDGTSTSKATSTINVTVTSTPTPTVDANDDAKTAPQGKGISGNVLSNDITIGTTTVTSITINGVNHTISSGSPATVTIPGKGTVIVNSDGTYTFSPLPTFTGTVPVEYTISNGTVTDKATLYLTSLPAVEATDDINQTPSGTAVSGGLLTNDKGLTSVTGASFNGSSLTVDGTTANTLTKDGVTYGTIVVNSDGTYIFTPATGYTGPVPPITYTATNAEGGTDNAKLYIEVATAYNSSTNNPPVANHDVATTKQGVEVTVKPLTNDSDPDASTTLSITEIKDGQGHKITATASTTAQTIYNADGTAVGTAYVTGGELKFTPNATYTGDVPFTYAISDGNNGTASSTINVTVLPAAATLANIDANDDANVKPKDVTMSGNVLTNDVSSVAGLSVTGASVTIGGTTTNLTPGTESTISGVGTITLAANGGDYTFDPDANFVGTVPVVYTIKNDDGSTDQATLYLTTLPTAIDQVWIGTDSKDWNTGINWKSGTVPNAGDNIVFATETNNPTVSGVITSGPAKNDLEVPSGITKTIGNLTNASTKNLIVPANTALIVNGVVSVKDPDTNVNSTDPSKIQIKAAENTANGTFIINCTAQSTPGSQGDIYVTVDLYAKGFKKTPAAEWTDSIIGSPTNGTKFTASYHWQHFGVPVETVKANPTFYGSYLRQYHEEWNKTVDPTKPSTYYAKWEDLNNESDLVAFKGYEITQDAATTYSIAGKLQYCDKTITLTRLAPEVTGSTDLNINNKRYGLGQNIFGNSYTASIDIDNLEFPEKVEPTVYLYNTGRFTDWAETTGGGLNVGTTLAAGQYTSIPQFASPAIYDGRIPSLNGFLLIHRGYSPYYASASDDPVTMTLPYANNLLPNTKPQTAPRKPLSYLQVNLQSKSTRDNLWLFSEEGTTNGNDDGWDGRKFFGTPTAFIYTENDDGPMQVSTNETIDGSVLSFYANSDTEYTLTLAKSNLEDYTDLHLIDLIARTATPLSSDTTRYHFTANSKGSTIRRFIIANSSNIDLTGDKFGLLHGYVKDNSRLIITNFTTEEGIVNLFDISGKRFINTKMPVSVSEIPVTLEPGVYILDLQADGKRESIKLIIK